MYHVITGLLLLGAFFAQGFGSAAGSALLVALGVGLEIWFWVRTARGRSRPAARKNSE
jgi:hypothetical protein